MPNDKDRGLTKEEYETLTQAIERVASSSERVASSSEKLDKDVEALKEVVKCCIHHATSERLAS